MANKLIKPMYRFFDSLYESMELIDEDSIAEWSHKEVPVQVYVVMSEEDAKEKVIDAAAPGIFIGKDEEEAKEILKDWEQE